MPCKFGWTPTFQRRQIVWNTRMKGCHSQKSEIIPPISHNYRKCSPFWWCPSVDVSSQKKTKADVSAASWMQVITRIRCQAWIAVIALPPHPHPPCMRCQHEASFCVNQDANKPAVVWTHLRQFDTLWCINYLTSLPSKACLSSISLFFCCLVFCATMIFDVISFYFLHFGKKKWGPQSNTKESQIKGSRVTWRMRGKQSIQATGPNTGNEQVPHVNTLTWWSEPCDPLTCCSAAACVDDWFQGGRGGVLNFHF